MKKLEISAEILKIPNVEVEASYITESKEVIIKVKSTSSNIRCHECGSKCNPYGKGETIRIRHLPMFGYQSYIEITPPKGICPKCTKGKKKITTTQRAEWYNWSGKITKSYEEYLLIAVINSTIQDAAIKENVGYKKIEGLIDKYIGEVVNWSKIKEIGLLGMDEISILKGRNNYYSIFTSKTGDEVKILGVIKGHEKAEVKKFLNSIPRKLQKTIKGVCTDMHDAYVFAVKESLPSVPLIVDRFHVAKTYRKCLKDFRVQVLKQVKKDLPSEKYKNLKEAIRIIKNNHNGILTDAEKDVLKPLFKISPELKKAFQLSRKLTNIFNTHMSKSKAKLNINAWIEELKKSNLSCYSSFLKTLHKYKPEILNYFKGRNNSGFVEGINNKIKVMKKRCYGISNIKHFFQRLFLDIQGYSVFGLKPSLQG